MIMHSHGFESGDFVLALFVFKFLHFCLVVLCISTRKLYSRYVLRGKRIWTYIHFLYIFSRKKLYALYIVLGKP